MTETDRTTGFGHRTAARRGPSWLPLLAIIVAAPLAACGSDSPPPVAGNLTDTVIDARGAHAGSFRGADNGTADYGNAAAPAEHAAENKAAAQGAAPDLLRKDANK